MKELLPDDILRTKISNYRLKHALTWSRLARMMEVSDETIRNYLMRKQPIKELTKLKIERFFEQQEGKTKC